MKFREIFYNYDWAGTALGRPETWQPKLAVLVDIMLESHVPMFILWGNNKDILFNSAFADILGERAVDAMARSLPELWSDIWETAGPVLDSVHLGHACFLEDIPLKTWASDFSETRYFSFSCTPVREEGAGVVGSVTLCVDTTDKVRSARRLKVERNAIFRLFNDAPGMIAMAEGPDHRFVFANHAYRKLVGRQDLVGRTVKEVFPDLAGQGFSEILDQVFSSGERFAAVRMPVELQPAPDSDPETHYVSFVYEPLRDEDGVVIGIFSEGQDVTEEVVAQEQVRLLQAELIHLSRVSAMDTMASTLAHELNQPLTAIMNYAEVSQQLLDGGGDTARIKYALAGILANTARSAGIIRSVRDMTQRGEEKREPFDAATVIREAGALAGLGECAETQIEYRLDGLGSVLGDAIQIQQVLLNLIRNACQAVNGTQRGRILVSFAPSGEDVVIHVDDNGPRINGDDFPNLFDAFFSTKPQGMGVGLSISRTIIEAHGGRLWAENLPDAGARFSFTLPLVRPS